MNADIFFTIGLTHRVCEDYARKIVDPDGNSQIWLSDGCSSSSDTDFGARLLVKGGAEFLWDAPEVVGHDIGLGAIGKARAANVLLGLHPNCLDATLFMARMEGAMARVYAWGDGVVAAQKRDGTQEVYRINYGSGAPPYLNYLTDSDRHAAYLRVFGAAFSITTYRDGEEDHVEEGYNFLLKPHVFEFDPREYELVLIGSDGLETFWKFRAGTRAPEAIPLPEVMGHILGIRALHGEFLQRRIRNRFLKRHCAKEGWKHNDDMSLGGLWLGHQDLWVKGGEE